MAYDNTIKSGVGDDTNVGDSDGNEGNNVIKSGDGDDQNCGDLGDDTINSGKGDDTNDCGNGNDKIKAGHGDDELMKVEMVTVQTSSNVLEYKNGQVAINPKFTKLITSLRTAVEKGEGNLDMTSYDDCFDSFRLSMMFWP